MTSRDRKAVIVLGMHRSGTSALSGALNIAGIDFASESKHFDADSNVNAKGYWEHAGIVLKNEKLLSMLDSSWDDFRDYSERLPSLSGLDEVKNEIGGILESDFNSDSPIGVKDPRMCRLLPIWLDVLQDKGVEPHFVIITRHPYEVAKSLSARDGMLEDKALLLWLSYVMEAEKYSRGCRRSFLTYHELMTDWEKTLSRVFDDISIHLDISSSATLEINKFLSVGLRHATVQDELADELAKGDWVATAYTALRKLEVGPQDADATEVLDTVYREFINGLRLFSSLVFREGSNDDELQKSRKQYTDLLVNFESLQAAYDNTRDDYARIQKAYLRTREAFTKTKDEYDKTLEKYENNKETLDAIKSSFFYRHFSILPGAK